MMSTGSSERATGATQAGGIPSGNTGCQSSTGNIPEPPLGAFELAMTSEDDFKAGVWLNPRSPRRTYKGRALQHVLAVANRRATYGSSGSGSRYQSVLGVRFI